MRRAVQNPVAVANERIPSIAESRENFRITAMRVYEIKNGEIGEMFRDGGLISRLTLLLILAGIAAMAARWNRFYIIPVGAMAVYSAYYVFCVAGIFGWYLMPFFIPLLVVYGCFSLCNHVGEMLLALIGDKGEPSERLDRPTNVAFDRDGYLYVTDFGRFQIVKFDRDGHFKAAFGSLGDGLGQFARPRGVALDKDGRLYAVDAAFSNVQTFNQSGRLLLFFGGPGIGPGKFSLPAKVAIDYDNLQYFQKYVQPNFELEYLILVTNQFGERLVSQPDVGGHPGLERHVAAAARIGAPLAPEDRRRPTLDGPIRRQHGLVEPLRGGQLGQLLRRVRLLDAEPVAPPPLECRQVRPAAQRRAEIVRDRAEKQRPSATVLRRYRSSSASLAGRIRSSSGFVAWTSIR